MPEHPLHPGLTAKIVVNGQRLPEFEDHDDQNVDQKRPIRYVEARSGDEFTVNVKFPMNFQTDREIYVHCYMDGTRASSRIIPPHQMASPFECVIRNTKELVNDTHWVKRNFKFGDLTLAEQSDDLDAESKIAAAMGMIELRLWSGLSVERPKKQHSASSRQEVGDISEKAMKGDSKSLRIMPGTSTIVPAKSGGRSTKFKYDDREPLALFVFKYRSKNDLEALHIKPRTPSTSQPIIKLPPMTDPSNPKVVKRERDGDSPLIASSQKKKKVEVIVIDD